MAAQRLYGIFWNAWIIDRAGKAYACPSWTLERNGTRARRVARHNRGICVSMLLPGSAGSWDAPTFKACADRVEADYRPAEEARS